MFLAPFIIIIIIIIMEVNMSQHSCFEFIAYLDFILHMKLKRFSTPHIIYALQWTMVQQYEWYTGP